MPPFPARTMPRICCVLLLCAIFCLQALGQETVIYIAPSSGNDQNDGLSKEKAVLTIERGLEIAKSHKPATLELPDSGTFHLTSPLVLKPEHSDLFIRGGKHTTLDGGRKITGWKPYKDGIWQVAVPDAKEGKWDFRQLYVNGELRQRTRTPNDGFFRVAACPEGTPKTVNYHTDCQSFEFKPGDIDPNWKNITDADAVVYYFWSDNHLPIESVDAEKHIVRFKYKGGKTFTDNFSEDGARYFVENIFETLDQPGEWYLDKTEGILYYMPKEGENLTNAEVIAPFATELLRIEGGPNNGNFVQNVRIEGITFKHCNFVLPPGKVNDSQGSSEVPAAVNLIGVTRASFIDCVFSDLGTYGLEMKEGCSDCILHRCEFKNLAAGAVRIDGGGIGSNPLLQTHHNRISDCEIENYGQVYPSAVAVILKNTYNCNVELNNIHHGHYTGISVGWVWGYDQSIARNNRIKNNHIHHIGQSMFLSDMGGIYTLGQSSGTVIWRNRIHDISAHGYGGWGIYSDEGSTGLLIEQNVVYNTDFAGYDMHYGKDVIIRNNIFALGKKDQINRTRGEEHTSLIFENNIIYWKEGQLFSGDWKDKEFDYYTGNSNRLRKLKTNFQSDWNIFYNPAKHIEEIKFDGGTFSDWQKRGHDQHSIYADPMFADPDNYDFRLKPESPALKRGFKQIEGLVRE